MIELLTNPALTMGASAIAGFFMKLHALDKERRQEERLYTLEAFKVGMGESSGSANDAASRVSSKYGKATRRVIAFALVLAVIALAFLPGLLDKTSAVQITKETGGWLFGLFPERTRTEFVNVTGFVQIPSLLVGFGHVVAFFFGQGAAKP